MNISKKLLSILLIFSILTVTFSVFFVKNESNAVTMSKSYTQYVKSGISAFPKSYQTYLKKLEELHPNWIFKAYYTGIDWDELTSSSAENKCKKNTIYFKSGSTVMDPKALCICGQEGDSNYYCASASTVNYYLDPRNFLSEAQVFQFLDLSYDEHITKSVITNAAKNSFLSGTFTVNGKKYSYVDAIMDAAEESKVSAMHILVTIFQEVGKGTKKSNGTYTLPKAVSGTVDGYEGVYNFYNYGATDGSGAVERGLKKAKEMGWTDPRTAIIEGATIVLANNYISAGQNTKYFYKFDVVGNEILQESDGKKTYSSSYFFGHQYMTNIQDPTSQANNLFTYYTNEDLLDNTLTFNIPVYDDMPSQAVQQETTLKESEGDFYWVNVNSSVNIRKSASTSSTSLGKARRGMVVAKKESSGNFYKVTYYKATSYDKSKKKWNGTKVTGYISKDYLKKCEEIESDPEPEPEPEKPFEIVEDEKLVDLAPGGKVSNIKNTYKDAKIKDSSGKEVTSTSATLATGYTVTINGKEYDIVVLGDTSGDGKITSSDYMKIKNHIMETSTLKDAYKSAADVSRDNKVTSSDYMKVKNHIMETSEITL